ncbi:MAG: HNH endonuclease family protein, partial [bacterium]
VVIDIDHVVALSNAWQTGAAYFDKALRTEIANDPLNLLAVDSKLNRQKGDGDAATWLPPSKRFRCEYVARQVAVKGKYKLWVTEPEKVAITKILSSCAGQKLPA